MGFLATIQFVYLARFLSIFRIDSICFLAFGVFPRIVLFVPIFKNKKQIIKNPEINPGLVNSYRFLCVLCDLVSDGFKAPPHSAKLPLCPSSPR